MAAYFALGFVVMVALVYGLRWAAQVNAATLANVLKYTAIAVALIGVVLMLVVGRLGLLFTIAGPLYLLWRRWQRARTAADIRRRQGGASHIETAYLSVPPPHDSGTVGRRVKASKLQ